MTNFSTSDLNQNTDEENSKSFLIYLLCTAVLSGALVMVIEVSGSRVVGPFFGVSLFVWTSLITVTLLALAGGYAIGGMMADRYKQPSYLFRITLTVSSTSGRGLPLSLYTSVRTYFRNLCRNHE